MVDLNTLISANGVTVEYALGINDQGQIVGTGLFNNNIHAFLLTPATKGTPKAQPASSTPPRTIAGPTSVPGSDTSVAPVLARPPSGSSSVGPTGAAVSLWDALPRTAPADAVILTSSLSRAVPPLPALTGTRPRVGDADSSLPGLPPDAVSGQAFADIEAQPFGSLVDDLALAGWGCDGFPLDSQY